MSQQVWLILAAAFVGLLVLRFVAGGKRVSSTAVRERIQVGASIVDVRTPEEFRDRSYPGAVNIPLQVLGDRLAEIPRDRPVVLYCASGARSAAAARLLRQAGFSEVMDAGGLSSMPR
jgi:rhodanese-related sulfurtransferase